MREPLRNRKTGVRAPCDVVDAMVFKYLVAHGRMELMQEKSM